MKRIMKIFIIGVCIGIVALLIQKSFHIDEDVFMRGYYIAAIVIVIGAVLFNILYNRYYFKKVRILSEQLLEEKPQAYIEAIQTLLKTAKGRYLQNTLRLNLTAGYMEQKRFEEAIEILEGLSHKQRKGAVVNVVYCINLFICYFETNQYENLTAALSFLETASKLNPISIKNASPQDTYEANHLLYLGYYLARAQNYLKTIHNNIEDYARK